MYWEKCGSCPEMYTQMRIPCWRFEAPTADVTPFDISGVDYGAQWVEMMESAVTLGSDISEWVITADKIAFTNMKRWRNNKWV